MVFLGVMVFRGSGFRVSGVLGFRVSGFRVYLFRVVHLK
jgi:hypothetical protein